MTVQKTIYGKISRLANLPGPVDYGVTVQRATIQLLTPFQPASRAQSHQAAYAFRFAFRGYVMFAVRRRSDRDEPFVAPGFVVQANPRRCGRCQERAREVLLVRSVLDEGAVSGDVADCQ